MVAGFDLNLPSGPARSLLPSPPVTPLPSVKKKKVILSWLSRSLKYHPFSSSSSSPSAPPYPSSEMDSQERIKLSKKLSYLCRHGAEDKGITIQSDGYIKIQHILASPGYRGTSFLKIQEVVQSCPKKRFEMKKINNDWYIRASQGHTMTTVQDNELLTEIMNNDSVNYCIHGTYMQHISSIQQNGLNRMKRNHIHFAEAMPGDSGVISGMRSSCTAVVIVDMKAAINDGIKFYRSSNNVILSPGLGETGTIPPQYIVEITSREKAASGFLSKKSSESSSSPPSHPTTESRSRVQHLTPLPSEDRKPSSLPVPAPSTTSTGSISWAKMLQSAIFESDFESASPPPIPSPPSCFSSDSSVDYYCIVDFEATCLENIKITPQEIIEFPAIMINARTMRTVESESGNGVFHSYVRPTHHPRLSAFCTDLTGIEQSTVDNAPTFPEVYRQFLLFLQPFTRSPITLSSPSAPLPHQAFDVSQYSNIIFVSHGNFDFQTALRTQCHISSVKTIVKSWINVKDIYTDLERRNQLHKDLKGSKRQRKNRRGGGLGMASMLENLDLQLIGRHHSGIDDSRNIARIFIELAQRGGDLTIYTTMSRS